MTKKQLTAGTTKQGKRIVTSKLKRGDIIRSPRFVFGTDFITGEPAHVGYLEKPSHELESLNDASDESRADSDFVVFDVVRKHVPAQVLGHPLNERRPAFWHYTIVARRLDGKGKHPELIQFTYARGGQEYPPGIRYVTLVGYLKEKKVRTKKN